MNILEFLADKFAARVKRIEEKPNPRLLKCNKLLYEIERDYYARLLENWRTGKPFAYLDDSNSSFIPPAMGIDPIMVTHYGDSLSGTSYVKEYFQLARSRGFPDNACDRVQLMAGIFLGSLRGDLPPPSLIISWKGDCDSIYDVSLWAARHYGVPRYVLDMPFEENWEAVQYVEAQLREMISWVEKIIPGTKFDESKLAEVQEINKLCEQYQSEIIELTKARPCPIAGRDTLRMPPLHVNYDRRVVAYYQALRDELRERVEMGGSQVIQGDEKGRVMWLVSAPFFADAFSFFEKRGIAVPLYEVGVGFPLWRRYGDRAEYGRDLTPLQEEAAHIAGGRWTGPIVDRRWKDIFGRAKEYGITGLVHFMQPGCQTCLGSAKLISDMAERELGIPSLVIEGCCQDEDNYDAAELERRVDEFVAIMPSGST